MMEEKIFRSFENQEERRALGGSCFIEFQYCRHPKGTAVQEIVDSIRHWENASLYVHGDDQAAFYEQYASLMSGCIHGNLQSGIIDMWGINYYSCQQTEEVLAAIKSAKPSDYQILAEWLERAKELNGFYILGI